MLARERRSFVAQQRAHDLYCFFETIDPTARFQEIDSICEVLVDLPSGTDAEDQSTVPESVDGCGGIR
jgi:hypothetical protein